ncbi:MAG: carboxypeptidase M32 [Bacillaceae bacterium]
MEQQFLAYVKRMNNYQEALSLMFWDLRTGAPKKGVEQRSEVIAQFSTEAFQMSVSDEMNHYLTELEKSDVSEMTKQLVAECKKNYDRNKKIPDDEYKAYVKLQTQAESKWEEAKEKSDFAMFQPYLEELVAYNKKFITYWGYEENPYNALLDMYEPGMTVAILDDVFAQLRENIVPLVQQIRASSKKLKTEGLYAHFPKEQQRQFSEKMAKELGYDMEAGRLDPTVHPFEITLNKNDVRITTKYVESDFQSAVFGTFHECGHAIYEQNISDDYIGTPLCSGTSMGIHESQSLFFETFVGRNESFWKRYFEEFKQYAGENFAHYELEDFYEAINQSNPSLIRIEADELTYSLHIMVRYEIEKGLFNGEIEVKDLPRIWNEKMEEYLGIVPENDGEGVLQDVHWAGGSFGYFPSYALGYMYAAQFKQAMLKDIPNFDELLLEGNIKPIKAWLTTHVHRFGKTKKPLEILVDATGEGLNASYFITYLQQKYKGIYAL